MYDGVYEAIGPTIDDQEPARFPNGPACVKSLVSREAV